ncbi:MAG: bifunctional phosphopantothenoylcysteine decarboxylase/phosphopantothenate--cysteine ligase CoaBC [Gammaproteobacteria bacterium]|nr:bifunctional phosphopantothenoylcysteine decarboxylase/phosphopantothenate--cysteine ligase CoaBC [Gammaproteobacteria bacterium]
MNYLTNKNILLAVTGGIAAYKSAEIVRNLKKLGSNVKVIMTKSSQEFITPLTLQALSGNPVSIDLLDVDAESAMSHIELARWADAFLVAPCTANTISRLAAGRGDDLLSAVTLAFEGILALAPAMNQVMWRDTRTQNNIQKLLKEGVLIYGPGAGEQACGDVGLGRMLEPNEIIEKLSSLFNSGSLLQKKVLITAGPTQEPIDPVRFISNKSSGKMGFAIAEAAIEAGAEVVLVSGPVNLQDPDNVHIVEVKTAKEMLKTVMHHVVTSDIFIGVAAVADYSPINSELKKIKKNIDNSSLVLKMKETKDILLEVGSLKEKPYLVGFAAETENLIQNAKKKLTRKNLDLIIANDVSSQDIGFDSDFNEVFLITEDEEILIEKTSKRNLSRKIIEFISEKI